MNHQLFRRMKIKCKLFINSSFYLWCYYRPTCLAWSARRCRRRCRGRTWSPSRGRSWGRGSWTGSWAAAAHTPAAGRSCSRSENITITSRKYLLEKQLLYYFPYFLAIYSVDATLELLVGTCDRVELLDHCIGGIVALQHHCNNIATCSFPIPWRCPHNYNQHYKSQSSHSWRQFCTQDYIGCTGVWGPPPPYSPVPSSSLYT